MKLEENDLILQPNYRHALAPFPCAARLERSHIAVPLKRRSNCLAQLSGALAMNHAYEGQAGQIRGIKTLLQHLEGFVDGFSPQVEF